MKVEKVDTLKSYAARFLSELHSPKDATVISEHGNCQVQILTGIAKGEADINAGRCFTDREARDKLKIWFE